MGRNSVNYLATDYTRVTLLDQAPLQRKLAQLGAESLAEYQSFVEQVATDMKRLGITDVGIYVDYVRKNTLKIVGEGDFPPTPSSGPKPVFTIICPDEETEAA